jgi:2-oxoglutarate dehydrogenase E2 component (dihydrolipoamide succinyltransferase)
MATIDLVMPKMGESIMEATILKWHKQPGDTIKMDETLLEIATDKVDSEVPSTAEGVLEEILYQVNDVVPIGKVIARIETGGGTDNKQQAMSNRQEAMGNDEKAISDRQEAISNGEKAMSNGQEATGNKQETSRQESSQTTNYKPQTQNYEGQTINTFYSPLVMNIAAQEGVSLNELQTIQGTGNEGRVTKRDILQFVSGKRNRKQEGEEKANQNTEHFQNKEQEGQDDQVIQESNLPATIDRPQTTHSGNVEIVEMDRMRKLIADHMVRSKHTSPHVTSFTEADVTNMVLWRDRIKKDFEKREGTKITYTPLFIEAIVRCIKRFPLINCSLDGNNIIIKKDINIGMATALPSGNLIVPVIRNADGYNLVGLAKQVNGLADAARNNKLKPDDISEGTFTMTNVGTFGSLMGTPIINQPQVAILAVGAIKKRPVVVETPLGDSIAIRHMMYLSMSYDHRIVDGSLGATFLTAVANELENFNANREF